MADRESGSHSGTSLVLGWQSQCHRAQRAQQVITAMTRQEASGREHQLALGGLPGSSFYLRSDMICAAVPRILTASGYLSRRGYNPPSCASLWQPEGDV
jgi:hypothetical protein